MTRLHAHTQVLGKLAVRLAPPEPQLQHAALRLTARGWETAPLPAPDGSGALVAALDLQPARGGRGALRTAGPAVSRSPPDRPVGDVDPELLAAVRRLGGPVEINTTPQEVPWTIPLDEDTEHHDLRPQAGRRRTSPPPPRPPWCWPPTARPFRGRSTPVNAWWGSFDLAVNLFSGCSADPPSSDFIMRNAMDSQEVAVGWWPGDGRYPQAAFYAFTPIPPRTAAAADPVPARRPLGLLAG